MYAKIFAQIYDGTLCTRGPWEALVTFQQFLVLADKDGVVDMTATAIARRTTIPIEIITKGIAVLQEPDPESRSPGEDGRRLVPLSENRDWGWQIVNYKHYRAMKREEERREYHRQYWHEHRSNKQKTQQKTQQLNQLNENKPIAEAEAEAVNKKPFVSREKIAFDGSSFQNISGHIEIWRKAYPAVDIQSEVAKAAAWLVANPKNMKKQLGRFLNNWLSRSQDKAPRIMPVEKADWI